MTGTVGDQTLVPLLREELVEWQTLEERYGALLKLVEVLLGVVPNCDRYLEIWPPAFRTYNVMVPNFLNLPAPIFGVGGAPGEVVGLGMYVSSRVAECSYCTAHSCSFALRRGASADKVAQALTGGAADSTRGELATIAVARSLGRVPCELTGAERDELVDAFGADRAEWIVLGVAMMGFLNKFMNAIGVELEQSIYSEVSPTLGSDWSAGSAGTALDAAAPAKPPPPADGLATKLRVLPLLPTALRLDARWQRGIPGAWPQVGEYLREHTGHDFPVLERLRHRRAARAIAFMLRENLSVLGRRAAAGSRRVAEPRCDRRRRRQRMPRQRPAGRLHRRARDLACGLADAPPSLLLLRRLRRASGSLHQRPRPARTSVVGDG